MSKKITTIELPIGGTIPTKVNAKDWTKLERKIYPQREGHNLFCDSHALCQPICPDFWATVYTYGDGEFLYKFGRRPAEATKPTETYYVYLSEGHACHSIGRNKGYDSLIGAQQACLDHISRVVNNEAKMEAKEQKYHRGKEQEEADYCDDYGYKRRNGSMKDMDSHPLTEQEQLDSFAKHRVSGEDYATANRPEPILGITYDTPREKGKEKEFYVSGLPIDGRKTYRTGKKETMHFWLRINGKKHRFQFLYHDYGTIGYAAMENQFAVGGELINLHYNWGKSQTDPLEIPLAHMVGSTHGGIWSGCLWICAKKSEIKETKSKKAA